MIKFLAPNDVLPAQVSNRSLVSDTPQRKTDGGDIFRPLSQAEFHQPPKPEKCPKESLNEGFALEIGRDWGTIDVFLKIEPFNLKPLAPDKHFRQ